MLSILLSHILNLSVLAPYQDLSIHALPPPPDLRTQFIGTWSRAHTHTLSLRHSRIGTPLSIHFWRQVTKVHNQLERMKETWEALSHFPLQLQVTVVLWPAPSPKTPALGSLADGPYSSLLLSQHEDTTSRCKLKTLVCKVTTLQCSRTVSLHSSMMPGVPLALLGLSAH